jgi:hypothetical protein
MRRVRESVVVGIVGGNLGGIEPWRRSTSCEYVSGKRSVMELGLVRSESTYEMYLSSSAIR